MANLLKVPCILAVTLAVHITHTQPAALSKVVERRSPTTSGNRYMDRYIAFGFIVKILIWVAAVAEILAIISPSIPLDGLGLAKSFPYLQDKGLVNLHSKPFSVAGFLLIVFGGSLRFWCYKILRQFHTFRLSIVQDHKLITTGPYSVIRHPSYTGGMSLLIGMILWYFTPGSILVEAGGKAGEIVSAIGSIFVLRLFFGIFDRIMEEDEMLKTAFGEAWCRWAEAVPYALIPGIY